MHDKPRLLVYPQSPGVATQYYYITFLVIVMWILAELVQEPIWLKNNK